jgi:hypothetical protein
MVPGEFYPLSENRGINGQRCYSSVEAKPLTEREMEFFNHCLAQ